MTLRLSFWFLFILCVSCHRNDTGSKVQTVTQPADSITPDIRDLALPVKAVMYDKIKILFTGTFHGDEVEERVETLPWVGLFINDEGNFVLTKIKIIATRVVDGLLDDEENGEKTGWEISTESGQSPTILISGGDLTEGIVEDVEVPATVYPGDSARFEFKGTHYLLYATGSRQMDSLAGVNFVSDYNLNVVRTVRGESRHSVLVSHASFDDAMTSILWSGDLDGDGYLDFLIDMSRHYNQRLPTLFLSKPSADNEVVVPVAEHSSVGC